MASLKDLKTRINSVKSTQKITAAMKMVAAAKLRRAQESAEAGRPYASRMRGVISSLAAKANTSSAPALLVGNGKSATHLLIAISADRGLCGGFNGSITRQTRNEVVRLKAEGKTVKLLMVGRKSADALRREFGDIYTDRIEGMQGTAVAYADVAELADKVNTGFAAGEFDVCSMIYNKFINAITQEMNITQLIPVVIDADASASADASADAGLVVAYDYEPEEEELLASLLPRGLATQMYSA
jgi:F-type H+-transporting ATPase subunit gamma